MQDVMAEIRKRAEMRQGGGEVTRHPSRKPRGPAGVLTVARVQDLGRLRAEVTAAAASHNSVGSLNPRRAGLLNSSVQLVKRIMARMLTWYTRPLHQFHGAVARSLQLTLQALDTTQSALAAVTDELDGTRSALSAVNDRVARLEAAFREMERSLRRLTHLIENGQRSADVTLPPTPLFQSDVSSDSQFDYFLFEESFRGPEDAIRERQSVYVDYFRDSRNVVDLGCGRGEFLDILRQIGVPARGVETGTDAFLLCKDKGLDVVQQDLFTYLESVEDASIGGIFSSQVIEHLPANLQLRMVNLARRKLASGAYLIIETINPECLYALSRNFFLDPTHVRPVHPETLAFMMRSLKFNHVELKFSSPAPGWPMPQLHIPNAITDLDRFNETLQLMNTTLFGNQDYAAIGQK
jgi:SAM-dependent methyltransferase